MGWPGLDRPGRRFLLLLLLMGAEQVVARKTRPPYLYI